MKRDLPSSAPNPAGAPAAAPSLALYAQVKDHISRKIQDGTWPPGHRLPSEHELVAQFAISRMTANRALRELSEQGRIVRVAGVGSFVAENKPQSTLLQIANIASEIAGARRTAIAWTTSASVVAVIEMVRDGLLPATGFLHQEHIPLEMFLKTPTGSLFKAGATSHR